MTKLQKLISLLLCVSMLLSAAALAEDATTNEVTTAVATTATDLASDTVLATLNGQPITWGEVELGYSSLESNYGSQYDMTLQENIDLFRAVALENTIVEILLDQKAKELGLDQLTEEELAAVNAESDEYWTSLIDEYIAYFYADLTEESTEEEKAAAKDAAIKYYSDNGYTSDLMREEAAYYAVLTKVQNYMVQDAVVTDEEVELAYQELLAADKELYQNDIAAYIDHNAQVDYMAMYAMMYGSASDMEYAWYHPVGFRSVKHILLPVDTTLMETYTSLQASLEEQLDISTAEPTTEETATDETASETPTEPVTEEQVNLAKAAILDSLASVIDEINQKIADGADFDELIATYGVNADGTASDPGMTSEPYKTSGYEVASASTNYVPEFVQASFSVDNIGDVSAPYLSDYGVHIVKYIADVPEGPIAMTDEQREAKRVALLASKQNELYSEAMDKWLTESAIEYTGAVSTFAELMAAQEDATTEVVEDTTTPDETDVDDGTNG